MSGVEPLLSRRAALRAGTLRAALGAGTAASAVALGGCASARPAATAPDGGPADADTDADTELVRRALARERRVEQQLQDASRRHPRLRPELQRLVARHRAHTEVLADALPAEGASGTPTRVEPGLDAQGRVRALAGQERALADAHARAALQARSGPFARVLAGMAAAAEQQAHVLDGLAPPRGRGDRGLP